MRNLLILPVLLISVFAFAEIHEVDSVRQIASSIDKNTLVVFDVDNTLLKPTQMLGSDQSFDWLRSEYRKKGYSEEAALKKSISYWARLQDHTKVVPVEKGTPGFVAQLQKKRFAVMGLTARGDNLAKKTVSQLRSIKIEMTRTSPIASGRTRNLKTHGGVLFASGQNKGVLLLQVLKNNQGRFDSVVFIDDKAHNVSDVHTALQRAGIKVTAFRYGAADGDVARFDPRIAKVQSYYFGRILSDKAATSILRN